MHTEIIFPDEIHVLLYTNIVRENVGNLISVVQFSINITCYFSCLMIALEEA